MPRQLHCFLFFLILRLVLTLHLCRNSHCPGELAHLERLQGIDLRPPIPRLMVSSMRSRESLVLSVFIAALHSPLALNDMRECIVFLSWYFTSGVLASCTAFAMPLQIYTFSHEVLILSVLPLPLVTTIMQRRMKPISACFHTRDLWSNHSDETTFSQNSNCGGAIQGNRTTVSCGTWAAQQPVNFVKWEFWRKPSKMTSPILAEDFFRRPST